MPDASANPVRRYHADQQIATLLTVVSMAALGLGVDVRTVAKAGGRVTRGCRVVAYRSWRDQFWVAHAAGRGLKPKLTKI